MKSRFRSQNAKKHTILGALLEVEMFKKCTALWREADFEVKMVKVPQVRSAFASSDVQNVRACRAQHIST